MALGSNQIANTTAQNTDLFGSVIGGLQAGLYRLGSDVLPNWAASQLGLQSTDQLADPMYNPNAPAAEQRATATPTTGTTVESGASVPFEKSVLKIGNIEIDTITALVGLAAITAAFIVIKKIL